MDLRHESMKEGEMRYSYLYPAEDERAPPPKPVRRYNVGIVLRTAIAICVFLMLAAVAMFFANQAAALAPLEAFAAAHGVER